jgi:very-short-patch-repair endonuclease/DNA polymerase III delta prime subunit
MNNQTPPHPERDRLRKVFEFLKAYTELRYPPVRDVAQQLRILWLKDLPQHPSVEVFQSDGESAAESEDADIILRITRPSLTACPSPPQSIAEWLKPGWQDIDGDVETHDSRNVPDKDGRARIERFTEVTQRPSLLLRWQQERAEWQANELPARQSLTVFQTVYEWFGIHEREAERIEILVADGLLHCPDDGGDFNHPVLFQKVELEFYPEKQHPRFLFRKREQPPELYSEFLRAIPGANQLQIARCVEELKATEFSPLGSNDTEGFLQRLINGLFPTGGTFISSDAEPSKKDPTIRRDPVLFMRQRQSGLGSVFDLVLEDIAKRMDFPAALLQIVGIAGSLQPPVHEGSTSMFFGNENEEILLSKPANKEQLEIAQQLERRDCVLVQGPPGTGKTHTIANLLGHLLAQGKRVLVTAHTPKALRVLRHKVAEPLQSLCISVLQNDKQSQEELQQSVRQINVSLSQDADSLQRDAEQLKRERQRIIEQLRETRSRLLDARQDEIRAVVFGGKDIRPIDAAKRVKQGVGRDDWIPSPVNLGETAPLSHEDVVALYQTNGRINLDDERELNLVRPDATSLPTPKQFTELVEEITALRSQNLLYGEEFWHGTDVDQNLDDFDRMLALAAKAIEFLRDGAKWQLEAVQAGRDGNEAKRVWLSLIESINSAWQEVQDCHELVMAHGPRIDDQRPPHEVLPIVDEIIKHIEAGKSFGMLTKWTKPSCHQIISVVRIGNRSPTLTEPTHFRAVRALLRIQIVRQELVGRWERQIAMQGGPGASELSDKPEHVCRQFVSRIHFCLDWHGSTWVALENEFQRLGFKWSAYFESTPPQTGADAELRRLRIAVLGDLEKILKARAGWLRLKYLEKQWSEWCALLPQTNHSEAAVTQELRQSLIEVAPVAYKRAYEELFRLKNLEADFETRRRLLGRLKRGAPAWASAIQNRHPFHSEPEPSGDPLAAWEWRQLHDELERRANVSFGELQQRIEQLCHELLDVTTQLVEKLTWLNLIRQTKHEQKQALGAYAAMRNKLTKSGKGVRDADLRAAARREMATAKGAVPVWIMPLNEVAETFDPRSTRFDVVIIDEASQCDPTAMFALYLGRQTLIVGDDEQVTPVAAGVDMSEVQKLITVHLHGIPFDQLYDGTVSIYEFAQISFSAIRLVEHFRCAPNIIAFSNTLSYKGEIKPLREASAIKLNPHVLPYRVEGGYGRTNDVNNAEAEVIASLICAAIDQPEYAVNEVDNPVSFGVVSLVGDQQAMKVDSILRQRLEPAEYRRRQILCGDAAQFQGDERDVMFLSVVDSSPDDPPLPMRQEGPKKIFKKRFNVAASRARDQMWIIYSLNHETDLKPADYRRRLIEHAIDPGAWEREMQKQLDKTESVFEERVLKCLAAAHYVVLPQYRVGGYRIDLVVVGGGKRLAVECDGERHHGPEKLQEDMERQAILERLGWQFVRIRGSIFFRDEDRAMLPVFTRLEELGITADMKLALSTTHADTDVITQRVILDAQELRAAWQTEKQPTVKAEPAESRVSRFKRGNLSRGQEDFPFA